MVKKADEAKVKKADEAVGAVAAGPTYSKADKNKIKQLTEEGVPLSGTESPEELDTLIAALPVEGEGDSVQEEIPGVPNKLPVRFEVLILANKQYNFPVFFMAAVKGGQAMYSYTGQRCSPAHSADDVLPGQEGASGTPTKALQYLIKACAKFNAQRRKSVLPGDPELGVGAPVR